MRAPSPLEGECQAGIQLREISPKSSRIEPLNRSSRGNEAQTLVAEIQMEPRYLGCYEDQREGGAGHHALKFFKVFTWQKNDKPAFVIRHYNFRFSAVPGDSTPLQSLHLRLKFCQGQTARRLASGFNPFAVGNGINLIHK